MNICDTLLNTNNTFACGFVDSREYFEGILKIVVMTYLHLGCANGCNEGIRTPKADFLRIKVKNLLSQMNTINQQHLNLTLKKYMEMNSTQTNCQSLLDFIHAMTMFCQMDFGNYLKNIFFCYNLNEY